MLSGTVAGDVQFGGFPPITLPGLADPVRVSPLPHCASEVNPQASEATPAGCSFASARELRQTKKPADENSRASEGGKAKLN